MVLNAVLGHTIELIFTLHNKHWDDIYCGCTPFSNSHFLAADVHVVGYVTSIGYPNYSVFLLSNQGSPLCEIAKYQFMVDALGVVMWKTMTVIKEKVATPIEAYNNH